MNQNEEVLVVPRRELEKYIGFRTTDLIRDDTDEILDIILDEGLFLERRIAETSPRYKQIIPYVLIRHGASYLLLQRTEKQTEERLHHKLSLGIGGHINPDTPELIEGLHKELDEEVEIEGDYDLSFVGILNDDSTDVGRVHLGAVYVLDSHSGDVKVRETEKMTGRWATVEELAGAREQMETWSQIALDHYIHER
ncbi:MAG TPA: DNA mismatch repair protein MutT [Thermoanaerobaculia bacterium]|jgi:predicted NUDIX family phosphoesterase